MTVTWFDGIQIQVLAGFGAAEGGYAVWGSSLWGTGTWGPDTTFTDISAWVQSIDTRREFSREVSEWETGTATIVLNNRDGRFSPSNPLGPYIVGGLTGIRPWRPIVVKIQGTPIFTGYAISWQETYDQGSPGGGGAYTTVHCVDEIASLARIDGVRTVAVGGGEASGKRIHRILDNANHTGARGIDTGRVTLQPTKHEDNTVTELKLVADTEHGAVLVEADGTLRFDDRYHLIEDPRSRDVQATFGDGGWQSALVLSGGSASTPDSSQLAVLGDLDVRIHLSLNNWIPGGFGVFLISQWPNVAGNNAWALALTAAGVPQLSWTTDGSTQITRTATEALTFLNGSFHWLRATLDVNNGVGGNDTRFYTSEDGVNWSPFGAIRNGTGTTSIFNTTANLAVSTVLPFTGQVRYAELRNGLAGTVVAAPDFALQTPGTASFRDSTGNTWTLTGNASIADDLTAPAELPYSDITPSYDGDQVVNIVSLQRKQTDVEQEAEIEPPVVTAQDETSRALYGYSRYARDDLINDSDADLGGVAEFYLAAHKDAEQRFEQITFKPRNLQFGTTTRAALIDCAVSCQVRDKIRVIRRPPGGEIMARNNHIAGISHRITQRGEWDVIFNLYSATVYDAFTSSFWDTGTWDEAKWFF